MSDFCECDEWKGHLKLICRGEKPGMPIESVNHFRMTGMGGKYKPLGPLGSNSPSLLTQAKSFAGAMGRAVVEKVKTGKALVPQEVTDERLAICKGCPFFTGAKCSKCGCSCSSAASFANKLALAAEKCPIKKWLPFVAVNPDNIVPNPTDRPETIPAKFTGPVVRHMIYHVWPTKRSDMWTWNVAELLKRIDQFDGKRIVGIATGKDTATADEVKAAFAGVRIDQWVIVPNDEVLGEGATFFKMMELLPEGTNDITWYGHSKGTKYQPTESALPAVKAWTDLLYRTTLDNGHQVEQALSQFPIAGPFKRYGEFSKKQTWNWHYSGTFFWFRNKETFSRDWRRHKKEYGAIEFWPSCIYKATESACLLGDDAGNLYDAGEVSKHDKSYADSLPSVSIAVTCKGRLEHLKRALPTMLTQDYKGKLEIIVVDYGCPDGTAAWCKTQPVKCVTVENDTEYFCVSRAKNIGAGSSESDIIAMCDAHNLLQPHYITAMVRHLQSGVDIVWSEHKPGGSVCRRETFHKLRGLDESLKLYGWEDTDYLGRARVAGLRLREVDAALLDTIHHTPEEQVRFYPNKDIQASIEINRKQCEDLTRAVNVNGYGV